MILSAIAAKLKQRAKVDFRGRHYEAALIVQAVSWYLRYHLPAHRDLDAAKRFFRKILQDQPLLAPDRIGIDGAGPRGPWWRERRLR